MLVLLVLTRPEVRPYLKKVTVAPITSVVRGLATELAAGQANGLDHVPVVNCDNIVTVPQECLARLLGHLMPEQEAALSRAIAAAFALEEP